MSRTPRGRWHQVNDTTLLQTFDGVIDDWKEHLVAQLNPLRIVHGVLDPCSLFGDDADRNLTDG
jgi:hypothetical protein